MVPVASPASRNLRQKTKGESNEGLFQNVGKIERKYIAEDYRSNM